MWKVIRITLLLVLLVVVAGVTWIDKVRTTSWKQTLWVGIFPMNGDGSTVSDRYVQHPWDDPAGAPPGYPAPMVDHAEERTEALRRYAELRR